MAVQQICHAVVKKSFFFIISGMMVFNCLIFSTSQANQNDILLTFAKFQAAIISQNGENAVQWVSQDTLNFYDDVRKLALNANQNVLELESQIKVSMTFELRYLLSRRDLQWLSDGKKIFGWLVHNELMQKYRFNECSLINIKVEGRHAFATILKNGELIDNVPFEFINEGGVWKFDMIKNISTDDMALEILRQQIGKTKIETALFLLEKNYHKKISEKILQGPLK